jgi:hypothetical protein
MELAKRIPSETSETVSEILKVPMSGGHNGFRMFPKEFGITWRVKVLKLQGPLVCQ